MTKKPQDCFFNVNNSGRNAVLDADDHFYILSEGYYRAAEKLLEPIVESGCYVDHEAYPIIYLCRHYIELSFKAIIWITQRIERQLGNSVGLKTEKSIKNSHSLKDLLNYSETRLKTINEAVGLTEEPFDDRTRSLVLDLDKFDPNGERFRYTVDINGHFFSEETSLVGLPEIYSNMKSIHFRFVGLMGYLIDVDDWASER